MFMMPPDFHLPVVLAQLYKYKHNFWQKSVLPVQELQVWHFTSVGISASLSLLLQWK